MEEASEQKAKQQEDLDIAFADYIDQLDTTAEFDFIEALGTDLTWSNVLYFIDKKISYTDFADINQKFEMLNNRTVRRDSVLKDIIVCRCIQAIDQIKILKKVLIKRRIM